MRTQRELGPQFFITHDFDKHNIRTVNKSEFEKIGKILDEKIILLVTLISQ